MSILYLIKNTYVRLELFLKKYKLLLTEKKLGMMFIIFCRSQLLLNGTGLLGSKVLDRPIFIQPANVELPESVDWRTLGKVELLFFFSPE